MEAWLITGYTLFIFVLGFMFGKHWRDMGDQLQMLANRLKDYKKDEPEQPKSMMVEPLTPEQQAAKDMADRVKRLNTV